MSTNIFHNLIRTFFLNEQSRFESPCNLEALEAEMKIRTYVFFFLTDKNKTKNQNQNLSVMRKFNIYFIKKRVVCFFFFLK